MTPRNEPGAITRIQIAGFRSLKSVDFVPGRSTVLIGPNGAGKSNFLAALRMLPLMLTQSLRRFVAEAGGASALLHYGPKRTREIDVRVEFEAGAAAYAYAAKLGHASNDTLYYVDETIESRPDRTGEVQGVSIGSGHAESLLEDESRKPLSARMRIVRTWLSWINFFHFHDTSTSSPLRQNSRQVDDRYLRSDGSNLASYLLRLGKEDAPEEDAAAWRRIGMYMRQIAPYVKRLEPELVDPGNAARSAVRLRWVDENDHRFDVSDFSDGTLRALALITALSQPGSSLPRFVTIDEPELGLHPSAISLLAGLVRSVAPRCQVILATQSPALLDHFEPEEVVVTERKHGESSLRRLDPEALAVWRDDYSLSELFDKNVLGGRP